MEAPGVERDAARSATQFHAETDGEAHRLVVPLRPVKPRRSAKVSPTVTRVSDVDAEIAALRARLAELTRER
jgi:hypothetical protein